MGETEQPGWWTEVEHLREPLERRRAARQARGEGERRTVRIRGQVVPGAPTRRLHSRTDAAEPDLPVRARDARPPRPVTERLGSRPDRLAAWAAAGGLLLVVIAAVSGHG